MAQNRFSTYLTSQKLAKSFLVGAEEKLRKGDEKGAIHMLVESVRAFQTSSNCLASLAFEPRKKHRVKAIKRVEKPKYDAPEFHTQEDEPMASDFADEGDK